MSILLRGLRGKGEEGEGEVTVNGMEWERRWRERFGPPKNFGMVP